MFKKVFLSLLTAIFVFSFIACNNEMSNSGQKNEEKKQEESGTDSVISMPVISPAAGDYSESFKEITLTTEKNETGSSAVDIFYTTDGTEPSKTSNRYTGPFKIIGSKTVKAICISGNKKSDIVTAIYNLNAGKTTSQLGSIKGVFTLADNLSDEVKSQLATSKVYISSSDLPGVVKEGKVGESFYIDGLDTTKSYDFFIFQIRHLAQL